MKFLLLLLMLPLSLNSFSQDIDKQLDAQSDTIDKNSQESIASAQRGSEFNPETTTAWDIERQNAITPFTNNTSAWVLGVGSVLTYAMYRWERDNDLYGYTEDHRDKTWCDWRCQGNIIGWGLLQVGYTLTQLPGIYRNESEALQNTEMMWKSTLYTSLYTLGLKLAVRSQRRNGEKKFESFPSGHASAAFAFATNVALRHEWYWNLISVPLALGVTASRVESDDHYRHDSIFGAALGISVAYGMNMAKLPFILGYEPIEDGGGVIFNYKF